MGPFLVRTPAFSMDLQLPCLTSYHLCEVVYSFSGQWMYFELMDTMTKPKDFPKAFLVAGPFMLITYLVVAMLGYWFGSGTTDLVGGMPHGPWLQAAAALLFAHVVIVYLFGASELRAGGCSEPKSAP